MNKYLISTLLISLSGGAEAHSHPAVDALSHAVEHAAMNAQVWHPYLLGLGVVALIGALLQVRRSRREESGRRPK